MTLLWDVTWCYLGVYLQNVIMCGTGTVPIHFCLSAQDQATLEQSQGSPRVAAGPNKKLKCWSSWSSVSNDVFSVILSLLSLTVKGKQSTTEVSMPLFLKTQHAELRISSHLNNLRSIYMANFERTEILRKQQDIVHGCYITASFPLCIFAFPWLADGFSFFN